MDVRVFYENQPVMEMEAKETTGAVVMFNDVRHRSIVDTRAQVDKATTKTKN
jgi:hypothetical protein